jgi:hypothetical protein
MDLPVPCAWHQQAQRAWPWTGKGKGKDGLSLADARLKAADARKKLAEGKDPSAERRAEKVAAITFGEFADALLMSLIG